MSEHAKRRLAAILAADVVGYSRLMAADELGTLASLNALRTGLIEPRIAAHDGRVVKLMGDGMLVEFGSVVEAARCAMAIQDQIAERADTGHPERRIIYRIGLHLGDIIAEDEDIHGDGVNVAARLQALAQPGAVVLSDDVYRQVRDRLDIDCHDLGDQELKNIPRPIRIWEWRTSLPAPAPLRALTPARPERPSIVILPFRNMSGGADQDWLADGLRIDIQNALVKVSGLFLIAAGSAHAFRGNSAAAATRHLGVQYALDGSVRRAGHRVRIALDLTDSDSGRIVWAETFDRTLDDAFALMDEIAGRVLTAMNVKLVAGEPARVWHKTLPDLPSLEALYKGIHAFFKMNREALGEARRNFEIVARNHPEAAAGPTWVALTHWYDFQRGWADEPERSKQLAREWAERATAMEDADGQAHTVLSHVYLLDRNFDAALAAGRGAVENRPNCTHANGFFGNVLHYCGEQQAAIRHVELAMRYSPLHPPLFKVILAAARLAAGQFDAAVSAGEQVVSSSSDDLMAYLILVAAYLRAGKKDLVAHAAEEARRIEPSFSTGRFAAGQPYRDETFLTQFMLDLRSAGLDA